MKTDDLIRALAADTHTQRPVSAALMMYIIPAVAFSIVLLWATLGFRADLAQSLTSPLSATRFVLTGALGLSGLRMALILARPGGRGQAWLGVFALIGAAALGLLVWSYLTTPAEGRQMAVVGKTMTTCLVMIPLLSIVPVAAILAALREGATTIPALTGAVAGLAGSGLAAAVYAMYCTEDSPLFYVTWYGLAIGGVALVTTLVGARLLRW